MDLYCPWAPSKRAPLHGWFCRFGLPPQRVGRRDRLLRDACSAAFRYWLRDQKHPIPADREQLHQLLSSSDRHLRRHVRAAAGHDHAGPGGDCERSLSFAKPIQVLAGDLCRRQHGDPWHRPADADDPDAAIDHPVRGQYPGHPCPLKREPFAQTRPDGRKPDEIRPVKIETAVNLYAEGSALINMGDTRVLCTASWDDKPPPHKKGTGEGWVTAQYSMLPRAPQTGTGREARTGRVDGRSQEIRRLIGRALRAAIDMPLMGERTIMIDCDVLQADGGTRTASITGGFVALYLALQKAMERNLLRVIPIRHFVFAVSVGIVQGQPRLDLNYLEDFAAQTDMNCVLAEDGRFIEIQGTAEQEPVKPGETEQLRKPAGTGGPGPAAEPRT